MKSVSAVSSNLVNKLFNHLDAKCPKCGYKTLYTFKKFSNTLNNAVCIKCGWRADEKEHLAKRKRQRAKWISSLYKNNAMNYFWHYSIIANPQDMQCTFDNFQTPTSELKQAKQIALKVADDINDNKPVHSAMLGDTGVGKTHLAYAIINRVWKLTNYQRKIIFVNMFKAGLLKHLSFTHKNAQSKLDNLIEEVGNADLVVADDLGAEAQSRNQEWGHLLVNEIAQERADKSIIITSNLRGNTFKNYSDRTRSRLNEHTRGYSIIFKNTVDYRQFEQN